MKWQWYIVAALLLIGVARADQAWTSGTTTLTTPSGLMSDTDIVDNATLIVTNGGSLLADRLEIGPTNAATLMLAGTGEINVHRLLLTNAVSTFSFIGGTLTTSNADEAARIVIPAAASYTVGGAWTMDGGSNTIVQESGAAGSVTFNSNITVNAGAIYDNGGLRMNVNKLMMLNGGVVTNVKKDGSGINLVMSSGSSVIVTNNGRFYTGSSSESRFYSASLFVGDGGVWDAGGTRVYVGMSANNSVLGIGAGGIVTNIGGAGGTIQVGLAQSAAAGNKVSVTNGGKMWIASSGINVGVAWGSIARSNCVMVKDSGSLLNIAGPINVGILVTSSYGIDNSLVVTNGGLLESAGANTIGNGACINSNWVYVGGAAGATPATWNMGGKALTIGGNAAATGNFAVVASGGMLTNGTIVLGGDSSRLYFNGGTLAASANGTLINTNGTAVGCAVCVQSGGAVIDSGSFSVTNTVSLLEAAGSLGGGLTKKGSGTLAITGSAPMNVSVRVDAGILKYAGGCAGSMTTMTVNAGSTCIVETTSGLIDDANGVVMLNSSGPNLGVLYLTGGVNEVVGYLDINGVNQAGGTWGHSGSGCAHTNDSVFAGLGVLTVQLTNGAPTISNAGGKTDFGVSGATLNGSLTGGRTSEVYVCWGIRDGGVVSTAAWDHVVSMGWRAQGAAFATTVSGLSSGTTYWYRCYAKNEVGTGWASPAVSFATLSGLRGQIGMKISFTNYNQTETLTNFPALVVLSNGMSGALFDFASFLSTNGYDLRFWADEPFASSLNYEIERWPSVAEAAQPGSCAYVWVQVPALTNGSSIWATWGDDTQSNQLACCTNGATWSNGFKAVWHLSETNGNRLDSVAGYVGTPTSLVSTNAVVGGGISLDGVSSKLVTTYGQPAVTAYTVMAWCKTTGGNLSIVQDRGAGSGKSLTFRINSCGVDSSGLWIGITDGTVVNNGAWHHLVGVWTAATGVAVAPEQFSRFVDGVQSTAITTSIVGSVSAPLTGAGATAMGWHQAWGHYLAGDLDEITISSVPRSSNWIWASFMNMASNSYFNTYGQLQSLQPVENLAPTGITDQAAVFNAVVACPSTNYEIYIYWGLTDRSNNAAAWMYSSLVGEWSNQMSLMISYTNNTLETFAGYYYTFRATNDSTNFWASPSWFITTLFNPARIPGTMFKFF